MTRGMTALVGLAIAATSSHAEVVDRSAAGFQIRHQITIRAPVRTVYADLLEPRYWWSSKHTYSGNAANLLIDRKSGCFCERLPGRNVVRHMQVGYSDGKRLVLAGALGPLSTTGATGHMIIDLSEDGENTRMTLTYAVGGYAKGGLAEQWAAPVDGVLKEQVERLKAFIEARK